jgi:hypothetical protein
MFRLSGHIERVRQRKACGSAAARANKSCRSGEVDLAPNATDGRAAANRMGWNAKED